jgi:copper oxidase (laccase) domain-containing protein
MGSGERLARSFMRRYGAERLALLLRLLEHGESGQAIADEFDVSRERVRQWKNAFGKVFTLYQVHADVAAVLREGPITADRSDRGP